MSSFAAYLPGISALRAHNWANTWEIDPETAYNDVHAEFPCATPVEIDDFLRSVIDNRSKPRFPERGEYVLLTEEDDHLKILQIHNGYVLFQNRLGHTHRVTTPQFQEILDTVTHRIVKELPFPREFIYKGFRYHLDPEPLNENEWHRQKTHGHLGFGGTAFRVTWGDNRSVISFNVTRELEPTTAPDTVIGFSAVSDQGVKDEWARRGGRSGVAA